jgi:hypothetical protein
MYEEPIDETEEIYEDEDFSEKDFGDEEDEWKYFWKVYK